MYDISYTLLMDYRYIFLDECSVQEQTSRKYISIFPLNILGLDS